MAGLDVKSTVRVAGVRVGKVKKIRIDRATGQAIVGNFGGRNRFDYSVIGDTVNLASRLESLSKELGAEIVVSEHTYDAVRSLFRWKSAGELTVRGRSESVCAYSIEGTDERPG